MLTITDLAAVNRAFENAAPRPWREVVLEIYPDATEDCHGRFHAPYDGYECPLTGKHFAAGEYLPVDEPEESYRVVNGRPINWPCGIDANGETHTWEGTKRQCMAVWSELVTQSRAVDAATSRHIGTVGDKVALTVTVEVLKAFAGVYGNVYIHVMKDASGNVVVYKGGKRLASKGVTISLSAKIKAHGEREGVKQTIIERPKLS